MDRGQSFGQYGVLGVGDDEDRLGSMCRVILMRASKSRHFIGLKS